MSYSEIERLLDYLEKRNRICGQDTYKRMHYVHFLIYVLSQQHTTGPTVQYGRTIVHSGFDGARGDSSYVVGRLILA